MANNLGSLVVSLGLDAGEFTRGLTKAEYQAQQFAKNLERGIEAARVAAIGSLAAIGGAALVLDKQLQSIAGFQDLADKIGDTAQEVASLQLAADLSGVSIDNIATASVKLTTALSKLSDEGEGAGKALAAIGLDLESFKQLSPVAQIDAVAQALSGFEDGASKTAVAVALFGKSGADLLPLFNDLAEQGGRQVSLTSEQISAADEYSKALARLTSEVRTLVAVTAADAAPAMTEMVKMLQDVKTYATQSSSGFNLLTFAMDVAKVAMQTIVVIGSEIAFVFKQTAVEIGGMAAQLVALAKLDIKGFSAISEAMKEDAARARKELDAFQKSVFTPATEQASYSNEARKKLSFSGAPGGKVSSVKAKQSEYDKAIEAIQRQEKAIKQLSAEETALDDIRSGRFGKITQQQQEELLFLARLADSNKAVAQLTRDTESAEVAGIKRVRAEKDQQIEIGKRLAESLATPAEILASKEAALQKQLTAGYIDQDTYHRARIKNNNEYSAALEKTTEAGRRLTESLFTPADKLAKREEEYQRLLDANEITRATYDAAKKKSIQEYLDDMDKASGKTKEAKSLANELGLTFQSAFEDAIVGGKGLSEVFKGLEKDIARVLIRKQVTEPFTQAVSKLDLGGLLGSLFDGGGTAGSAGPLSSFSSFAGGGYTGDGARSGGLDGQGGYLAMLHPQESVVDHAKGQTMGGGTSINQSITIDARGADAGVTERIIQAMRQTKAETLAAVQAQANRGGSFARSVGRA